MKVMRAQVETLIGEPGQVRYLVMDYAILILQRSFDQQKLTRGKKRAVIAVARKLAVPLHRLWVSGDVYMPLRPGGRATLPAVA